jgi:drug/metabolite transporter (DMT)-like permease
MESWLIYVIASTWIYALVTLLDRHVMALRMISPVVYLLLGNISGLFLILFFLLVSVDTFIFKFDLVFLGLLVGILFGAFTYLYFLTLQTASPVATVAYMQIVPAVTTLASVFLLHEGISEYGFVAILLLSIGLTFVSLLDRKQSGHAAVLMIPAVLLLSLGYIVQKHLLGSYSVILLLILNRIGATSLGFFIFFFKQQSSNQAYSLNIKANPYGSIAAVVGEFGSIVGLYFLLRSYESGPFAEVSAIASTIPVAVLIGAIVLRKITKKPFWIIPEIKSTGNLLLSIIAILLISLSIFIIAGYGITYE